MTSCSNFRCVVWVQPRNPAAALYPFLPSVPSIPIPNLLPLQPLKLDVARDIIVGEGWEGIIWNALKTINYLQMFGQIQLERDICNVYPAHKDVFAWTRYCRSDQVKVVIVGQDPYHNGCADGLAFSMPGERPKDSLENIMKLLPGNWNCDKNRPNEYIYIPADGNLGGWARQGVLLLNRILTVKGGKADSHKGLGWKTFTDSIIHHLHQTYSGIVFILWGKKAGKLLKILKESERCLIDGNYQTCQKCKYKVHNCLKHNCESVGEVTRCERNGNCFLQSDHPSPLAVISGGDFLRQSHLIMANEFLALRNKEINWEAGLVF